MYKNIPTSENLKIDFLLNEMKLKIEPMKKLSFSIIGLIILIIVYNN